MPTDLTLKQIARAVDHAAPRPHHTDLLGTLKHAFGERAFALALTRGGWHRAGGVFRPDGIRLAYDLGAWITDELEHSNGSFDDLIERHLGAGLVVSRQQGRTHYFVSSYGPDPADYLQLEIEELQEVMDRKLMHPLEPPLNPAELLDPPRPHSVGAQPVGATRYHFRRLVDMRRVVVQQATYNDGPSPLKRFLAEWAECARQGKARFSDHWILSLREHVDRYYQQRISAEPVSRHARKLKSFEWHAEARGAELARQLEAFDRVAGYQMAWYFHMVAGGFTPLATAYTIVEDYVEGARYLGDQACALTKRWLVEPYTV
ncbi:MAG: hypothetical protein ACFCUG_11750 [Thiotrichales bacterium]